MPATDHANIEITGLTCDSRRVAPGFLFAALPGARTDGRAFIGEAQRRGAVAVLAPPGPLPDDVRPGLARVFDPEPRRRYALLAARLHPGQPETIAGVTGTNGKTSVVAFARQIWDRLGHSAASLGTLGVQSPTIRRDGGLTTPDPTDLHELLDSLAGSGVDRLALEASSHGLDQFRLDGVRIVAAGFTNLSRDHLDYHADLDAYMAAKARLFDAVMAPGGTAVLNADTAPFGPLSDICARRGHAVLSYGIKGRDLRLTGQTADADGQTLHLSVLGRVMTVRLPLAGAFQAANALCALGLVIATGGDPVAATAALHRLEGVPGRLQRVATHPGGAPVVVDYAHTPDALQAALDALRPHVTGRLWLVFGCGGDRDRGKRPRMGALAARLADRVIVTDDNPRGEDPAEIRAEIRAACPDALDIGDRAAAIARAVDDLRAGDLLLIAGKGHERGQIVGDTVHPFDDAGEVRRLLDRETFQ